MSRESSLPPCRGIYGDGKYEPDKEWRSATSKFPNAVPRFSSEMGGKEACEQFMKAFGGRSTNPTFSPTLQHCITTLIGWKQVQLFLLKKRDQIWNDKIGEKVDSATRLPLKSVLPTPLQKSLESRFELPFHRHCISHESTYNTLRYMFYHLRCGIFVLIKDNRLRMFVPFVNDQYRNTWGQNIPIKPNFREYYKAKRKVCREENILTIL